MFLKVEPFQLLFIDIDTFSEDYCEEIWKTLANSVKLVFFTVDVTNPKIQNLHLYGEVCHFFGFSNIFAFIDNNNLMVEILNSFNIKSDQAAVVTKSIDSLDYLTGLNIRNILVSGQGDFEHAPDFLCRSSRDLIEVTQNILGTYFAENFFLNHPCPKSMLLKKVLKSDNAYINVFAGGRYYKKNCCQSQYHFLSNKIISNKTDGKENPLFYPLYKKMIKTCWMNPSNNTIIVSVPPQPGKINRFKRLVENLSRFFGFIDGSDYIICPLNYGNNKSRNAVERAKSLQGVFCLNPELNSNPFIGKNVIIIDDIVASGATISEIGSLLLNNNANNINAFVMGINQKNNFWENYSPLLCPNCNVPMILRMRNRDSKPFFGCQNYFSNGCTQTISFDNGMLKLKALNNLKVIEEDPFEF